MKLKKIMSVVAAATLAAALCVPAFAAEEATPGEVAQGKASDVVEAIQSGNAEAAKTAMKDMTAKLQDETVTVSPQMHNAGLAYYDYLESTGAVTREDLGNEVSIRNTNGDTVTLNSCTIDAAANTVTVDIDVTDVVSVEDGYSVTIDLPSNMTATYLKVSMINEATNQPNDSVAEVRSVGGQKSVTFWVPHFTTYQLTPISVEQPSQGNNTVKDEHPEIAEAIANGTWGKDDNATSTSGTSAVTENPIKKTGTEMSVVLFAVTVLAAVAVGGVSVAVNKSRKGE